MHYVLIGASAAGVTAARIIRRNDPMGDITVISRDNRIYSRCMLHLKLSGQREAERLSFVEDDFFAANRIAWLPGKSVVDIRVDDRAALLDDGTRVPYDRLLIASGASSTVPPIPNLRGAANVHTLRNMDDVEALEKVIRPGLRAVIIGAGLVGMDAAVGLLEKGVKVTLVEMFDRILAIQLDARAAGRYEELLRRHGAEVVTGAKVKEAAPDGKGGVKALVLADGRELPCDICLAAAGVSPNISFIKDKRLRLTENGRAIAVDRRCRTSVENIYAAGDVTFLAPIWPEAVRQAQVAAENMTGGDASLPEKDWSWTNSMNFFGLPTVSYGRTSIAEPGYTEDILLDGDVYKKIIHRDGVIHGAIFQGDIDNCGVYLKLIKEGINIAGLGKQPLDLNYADVFQQAANGEFL